MKNKKYFIFILFMMLFVTLSIFLNTKKITLNSSYNFHILKSSENIHKDVTTSKDNYDTGKNLSDTKDSSVNDKNFEKNNIEAKKENYITNTRQDLLCLQLAYAPYIKTIESEDDKIYLIMKSGKRILYDDKKNKTFDEKIMFPDIQDMLEQIYNLSEIKNLMPENYDPGRIRCYEFFNEVYGNSKNNIEKNLTTIKFNNLKLIFNNRNNASDYLQKALSSLIYLANNNSYAKTLIFPINGTYNYKNITGSDLLSPHSYGIAIDFAVISNDYWLYASKEAAQERISKYCYDIVKIMEDNYFIWGGKWYHFDLTHYEYRPEIILKSKYFSSSINSTSNWYEPIPEYFPNLKKHIKLIESINISY